MASISEYFATNPARKAVLVAICAVGFHVLMQWWLGKDSGSKYGYHSTATQVASDFECSGKIMIVTGSNTGLGLETAKALYSQGARVILASRNREKCESARLEIIESVRGSVEGSVECIPLDLSDLLSVRDFAQTVAKDYGRVDALINKARTHAPKEFTVTKQGFESQFGVNHLGHFYLTRLLTPLLLKSQPARVVSVSSLAHRSAPDMHDWLTKMEETAAYANASGPLPSDYELRLNYCFSKA